MAKAGSPPKADNLDEQISSLLDSVGVNGKEPEPNAPPPQAQEKDAAGRRRSVRGSSNGSQATPAPPPVRKEAKKSPARPKAAPVAKKAARRRKAKPTARVAKKTHRRQPAKPRAQARPQAPARARTHARPRERGHLFADPSMRELAFLVFAALMIELGALVGVLFVLAGS